MKFSLNSILLLSICSLISNATAKRYLRRIGSRRRLSNQGEGHAEKDHCDLCLLPKAEGSCRGMHPRWFYNGYECEFFFFGGCSEGANGNRFSTQEACENRCASCNGSSVIENDTHIDDIVPTVSADDAVLNGDDTASSRPLPELSISPPLLETETEASPVVDSTSQDDIDIVVEEVDDQLNDNEAGKLRADSIIFKKPSVQVLFMDDKEPDRAPMEAEEEEEFYFKTNPTCVISPPSATLVDPEKHKIYLPSGEKGLISMTCKNVQLGGAAGLISEEICSKVKTSLACPFEWSNLKGENGENAKKTIEKDIDDMMPEKWKKNVKISIVEEQWWFSNFDWSALSIFSSSTTSRSDRTSIEKLSSSNYQADRIRIYVDNDWNVITAPRIG